MVERGCGITKGEATFIQVIDQRSARTDVDVGRKEGESCVGVGERLEMRGAGLQPGKV